MDTHNDKHLKVWEQNWKCPVIDHFLLYCDNLEQAIDKVENLTGIRPVIGGKHIGRGTHNAVISLAGENPDDHTTNFPPIYLELIAKDPDQIEFRNKDPTFSFFKPSTLNGKVVHWAAVTPPSRLSEFVNRANDDVAWRTNSWPALQKPFQMHRTTPDMQTIQWTISLPSSRKPLPGDGLLPFLLDWEDTIALGTHPGQTSPKGITLKAITLRYPKHHQAVKEGLQNIGVLSYETNGGIKIMVEGSADIEPSIVLHLKTPNGDIDLSEF